MPDALDKLYGTPHNYNRLGRARELAAELGITANQVALAYLLNQDFSVFPIIGSRTPEQLLDSCDAAKIALTPDQLRYLDGAD